MSRRPERRSRGVGVSSIPGWFKLAFVLLVGLSGATMALQGDGSIRTVSLAFLGGALAGSALLWYLLSLFRQR